MLKKDMVRLPSWIKVTGIVLVLLLVATLSFAAGFGVCSYRSTEMRYPLGGTPEEHAEQFRIFWEAWHIVEEQFYHPGHQPDPQEMTYGAIGGALNSLGDPYTNFTEPVYAAIFDEDMGGNFEGIGATVNMQDGQVVIVRPLPGSPAEKAGLLPADIILEVDGTPIEGMNLLDAIALIRGPEGTTVLLTIQRPSETDAEAEIFEVEITRKKLELPTVEARMLDDGIAYIRLYEFNSPSANRMKDTLEELLEQDPQGLIFDLRDNPGGYLQSAVSIASQFIGDGVVLYERGRDGSDHEYSVRGKGVATSIPLVVLVNGGSASASEIVAGAIQDHNRGILIGQQTVGKGSVQTSHHLSDGSSLRVTIARWYTPNDEQIDMKGLTPDIVVENSAEDLVLGLDPQLERAQQYLLEQLSGSVRVLSCRS